MKPGRKKSEDDQIIRQSEFIKDWSCLIWSHRILKVGRNYELLSSAQNMGMFLISDRWKKNGKKWRVWIQPVHGEQRGENSGELTSFLFQLRK